MKSTIKSKIQRAERIRELHTIISQQTIKPSSPTPPHLKIHKLSLMDHFAPNVHFPWIFLYQNHKTKVDIDILKKGLSNSLTQYYPFAGRYLESASTPYIECNDQGVEFLEASIDNRLEDFMLKKYQDETLDQLLPYSLGCARNKSSPNITAVQLNHLKCGGTAVGVSISHKVADALTMANFCNHWATLARGGSPLNPVFLSSSLKEDKIQEFPSKEACKVNYASRRFVFPNSKINELKNMVNTMGTDPVNPTRVESLTSLIFKCAAQASTTKSGLLQPLNLIQMMNLRGDATGANLPKSVAGNLVASATITVTDSSQIKLNEVIGILRKQKFEFQKVTCMEQVREKLNNQRLMVADDESQTYGMSSLCRIPFTQVNFGWGKPVRVMLRNGTIEENYIVFMDTPSGDGIEATVQLEKEELAIFENDKELLAFAQDI